MSLWFRVTDLGFLKITIPGPCSSHQSAPSWESSEQKLLLLLASFRQLALTNRGSALCQTCFNYFPPPMIRFQLSASKFLSLSRVGAHLKLRWVCAAFTFWYSCPQANNRPIKLQPKLLPRCSEISFRYFRYIWPRSSNQSLIASLLRYFLDQSRSLFWEDNTRLFWKRWSL